jgi:DNA end-binding protein Ku
MLDQKGVPLERRYFDPESGDDVSGDQLVRGYEVEDGTYVVVEDEELEALAPEKSRDLDLRRFVPVEQLDPIYFERSYLLAPGGASTKAYRLLAETMERTGRAGIATFVMRGVEYLTAILAEGGVLRAETLRFQDEVRTPEDVGLSDVPKASASARKRFVAAIRAASADELDEAELEDTWTERLEALVRRKRKKGEGVVKAPADEEGPADVQVIDLLEVLKRSMSAAGEEGRAGPRRSARKGEDLGALSKRELYERAKALDIPGRSSMSKSELARAIRGAA